MLTPVVQPAAIGWAGEPLAHRRNEPYLSVVRHPAVHMMRRTFRHITIALLVTVAVLGLSVSAIVIVRSAVRRALVETASRAGVDLAYGRLRLSPIRGVILRDVRLAGASLSSPVETDRVVITRRRVRVDAPSASVAVERVELEVTGRRIEIEFDGRISRSGVPPIASVRLDGFHVRAALPDPGVAGPAAPAPLPAGATEQVSIFPHLAAAELDTWRRVEALLPELPRTITVEDSAVAMERSDGTRPSEAFGASVRWLELRTDRERRAVEVEGEGVWDGAWHAAGDADPGAWRVAMEASFDDGVWSGEFGVERFAVARDRVSGELDAHLSIERKLFAHRAAASGRVALTRARLLLPAVADEPIELADVSYEFALRADALAPLRPARLARRIPGTTDPVPPGAGSPGDAALSGAIVFDSGALRIGPVSLQIAPSLRGFGEGSPMPARADLRVSLPRTPLGDIAEAVPRALLGVLDGVDLTGEITWELDLEAPLSRISWAGWVASVVIDALAIRSIPPGVDVRALHGAFLHRIARVDGVDRVVLIPADSGGTLPGERGVTAAPRALVLSGAIAGHSPDAARATSIAAGVHRFGVAPDAVPDPRYRFAPLGSIAPWMINAIITGEDGEFYRHDGVNWLQAKSAVERNLGAGEILVGASTIQMQLAKNLFLDHDRLASRKLQEVLLVALMQLGAQLPRERIMEIYLNVIEFGPGIYGIEHAARYYFGKTPATLSLVESVWLASIVPSPQRFHAQFENRSVPSGWLRHMRSIMDLMLERGRITPEQHERGHAEVPVFRSSHG